MSYQPLDWNQELLLRLKNDKINIVSLYEQLDLSSVERFSFDRALAICNFLNLNNIEKPVVLDLGSSGGVFSFALRVTLNAHVTAVDDDRYINIQKENEQSSIMMMRERLEKCKIDRVIPVNSSIEDFLHTLPPFPVYDVVLLLNILHHFYTGYGQMSQHGKMNWGEKVEILRKIGLITKKYLFFEINSLVINDYEKYLTDIMYAGEFKSLEYVSRSVATDGKVRAIWCFKK
ncbi:class I SAM-dependent methyltransferase [Paenibacillus sp. MSJ-34]|uniref:class I SAM-dependent methyltransferase n=1 Tax=Paenibacillus sp. MSJ-34 TaxID=2841529 RepID=UPI001C10BBD8|nr:class I SAM-dependent methyltransferase [Paenibacillus sp. MSJ-34]MBU5444375.1 class I SAM-dependent methyltransferase [Paenibacillus sp. MSJ-34]